MATLLSLPNTTVLSAGSFTSANFTFPSGIASVTTAFTVQAPDLNDATKTMTFELWRETSQGSGVFMFDHGFTWQGGQINSKTGLVGSPSIVVDAGPLAGTKCQVRMTLNKSLNAGVVVSSA